MSGRILTWSSLVGCVNDKLGSTVVSVPSGKDDKRCVTASDVAALNALYDNVNISCSVDVSKRLITAANVTASMVGNQYDTNGYEYVDLGLPSGTIWSKQNVRGEIGQTGSRFQWGDVEPKGLDCKWSNYKHCNGSSTKLTKYCENGQYGIVDNKTVLDAEDDAATYLWGGVWHTPTMSQLQELQSKCTWSYVTSYGGYDTKGYIVKGPNKKEIFLPLSEAYWNGSTASGSGSGFKGFYWSRNLRGGGASQSANYFGFSNQQVGSITVSYDEYNRAIGMCIRPVFEK